MPRKQISWLIRGGTSTNNRLRGLRQHQELRFAGRVQRLLNPQDLHVPAHLSHPLGLGRTHGHQVQLD